jgi:hypothetical protein
LLADTRAAVIWISSTTRKRADFADPPAAAADSAGAWRRGENELFGGGQPERFFGRQENEKGRVCPDLSLHRNTHRQFIRGRRAATISMPPNC